MCVKTASTVVSLLLKGTTVQGVDFVLCACSPVLMIRKNPANLKPRNTESLQPLKENNSVCKVIDTLHVTESIR